MKQVLEINKCPNCGGKTEVRGHKMVCLFCDSEFELDGVDGDGSENAGEKKGKKNAGEGFNKPEWFDYRVEYKKLLKGHDTKEAMREFSHCIDDLETSESIEKYIKKEMAGENGIYYEKHKPEKLKAFLGKPMSGQVAADERVLFYVNTAVFSCGKHGFLVTDKKIVFSGKKPQAIYYSDLQKLAFDMDSDFVSVHINGRDDTKISCIEGGSCKPYGAIAALISAFAFEQDPGRDKIIIDKYDFDEDDDDDEDDED